MPSSIVAAVMSSHSYRILCNSAFLALARICASSLTQQTSRPWLGFRNKLLP
jgi:hypothetical protein